MQSSVCKILFSVFIFSFRFVGVAEADPANIYPSQVLCVEFLGVQWELSRSSCLPAQSWLPFGCVMLRPLRAPGCWLTAHTEVLVSSTVLKLRIPPVQGAPCTPWQGQALLSA